MADRGTKRAREPDEGDAPNGAHGDEPPLKRQSPAPPGAAAAAAAAAAGASGSDSDSDGGALFARPKQNKALIAGAECPFLDTVNRAALDFDFERCCSVTLSRANVYACLACGRFFGGRAPGTPAHTHALDAGHRVFMRLDSGAAFCLPDGYQVADGSLDDVRHALDPRLSRAEIAGLDSSVTWARALDGDEYMPGLVGLNGLKRNGYANAVVQALLRVRPLRDFLLRPENYAAALGAGGAAGAPLRGGNGSTAAAPGDVAARLGELARKAWNARAFRAHVSPHEFALAVRAASGGRFSVEAQADPAEFFAWLANRLHLDLTGGRRKRRSAVTDCLQGELEATPVDARGAPAGPAVKTHFFMLGLDLPPAPLFRGGAGARVVIPQVPLAELLRRFDGGTPSAGPPGPGGAPTARTLRLAALPRYLVLHVRRFARNQFATEKNPTLVTFPVRGLDLAAAGLPLPPGCRGARYDLVANIVHEGGGAPSDGAFKVHVHRASEGAWYEVQDLRVADVLPQVVALSEAYLQVWERVDAGAGGGGGGGDGGDGGDGGGRGGGGGAGE